MAKKNERSVFGKFAKDDNKLPITNKPGQNEDGPGKSYEDQVMNQDYPIRGVRKGFS